MTRYTEEEYQAMLKRSRDQLARAASHSIKDMIAHPIRRSARTNPEDAIQLTVCEYWENKFPATWKMTFHVPNGLPALSPKIAARFKSLGFKPGIFDLLCIARRGPFAGFALELKSAHGTMRPAQNEWQQYFAVNGWYVAVGFTVNTAIAAVEQYHQLPPPAARSRDNEPAIA